MRSAPRSRNVLAASLTLALAACGGGGGTKSTPPPVNPPPTSPPPTSTTPQPAMDAHLALTNARAAQAAGYTGAGIRIGVVDSGVMRNHPALAGRVLANFTYVDPRRNNLAVDDVVGHGTTVAQLAAGKAVGILAPVAADARRYLDMGMHFVAVGTDIGVFKQAVFGLREAFPT